MKKLYIFSGIIILSSIIQINAMQENRRQEAQRTMDTIIDNQLATINWNAVFELLDSMKDVINARKYRVQGGTASLIEMAVMSCLFGNIDISIVRTLLKEYHADPNVLDATGNTPLMYACQHQNIPLIKLLLGYGANPYQGTTRAFDIAQNNPKILELMMPIKKH